jgi:uracil-DNA glycosylase family 4
MDSPATQLLTFTCKEQDCPLYHQHHFVPTEVTNLDDPDTPPDMDNVDVMFIGEAPGQTEADKGYPFCGRTGQLLRRVLGRLKFGGTVAFSNVVRCRPVSTDGQDKDRKPEPTEVHNCIHKIQDDINELRPKVLVLLGATPYQAITKGELKITEARGGFLDLQVGDHPYKAIATFHPSYVSRHVNLLSVFYDDIRKAKFFRDHPDKAGYERWQHPVQVNVLKTVREVGEYVDHLLYETTSEDVVAFDLEANNLNRKYGNKITMLQFSTDPSSATVIPYHHIETPFNSEELKEVKRHLYRLFTEKPNFRYWITHGGKFDQTLVKAHITGRTFSNAPLIDTLSFCYVMDENRLELGKEKSMSLKALSPEVLGYTYDAEDLEVRKAGGLHKLPLDRLAEYGGRDSINTLMLYLYFVEQATFRGKSGKYLDDMLKLLEHVFGRAYRTFSNLEYNGFFIDIEQLRRLGSAEESPIQIRMRELANNYRKSKHAKKANKIIENQLFAKGQKQLFGKPPWRFDITKKAHLLTLFFDVMNLRPIGKPGKSGEYSVNKAFFDVYREKREVAWLAEWRSLQKLSTSYVDQISRYVDPSVGHEDSKDGRVRPSFWFESTVSGRTSCSGPNLQQIPSARTAASASIKNMFVAQQPEGLTLENPENCLIQLDFMANEVRWWCIISQDEQLAQAFNEGKRYRDIYRNDPTPENEIKAKFAGDVHKMTASLMFQIPVEEVTKEQRQATKNIVFGWMFGRGTKSIAAQLHNDNIEEVQALCDRFGNQFVRGAQWLRYIEGQAAKRLFVRSPIGRRRRLLAFLLDDFGDSQAARDAQDAQAAAKRMARNSPIQGVASDASVIGSSLFSDYLEDNGLTDRWLIQNVVHDSCIVQVPIAEVPEVVAAAERIFTTATMDYMKDVWNINFICPIEVEFELGLRWGELKKWDFAPNNLTGITDWLSSGAPMNS